MNWLPLESDPAIFTELLHALGVESIVTCREIYTLDQDLSSDEILAWIVIHHAPSGGEVHVAEVSSMTPVNDSDLVFIRQTIHNACGLYAILHAVFNSPVRTQIKPDSILCKIGERIREPGCDIQDVIVNSPGLEREYKVAAAKGTPWTEDLDTELDYHYVCFVRSPADTIYMLDGDEDGPYVFSKRSNESDYSDRDVICDFVRQHEPCELMVMVREN